MGVPGVANVAIWGQREHQLQVQVDPERLRETASRCSRSSGRAGNALLVSPLSFLEASTPGTGGFIDTPNQRLQRPAHPPDRRRPKAWPRCPSRTRARQLRLGDVATVVEDHQPLIGDAVVGDGDGLLLVVEKFPGANTLEVTRGGRGGARRAAAGPGGRRRRHHDLPARELRRGGARQPRARAARRALLLLVLALGAVFFDWRSVADRARVRSRSPLAAAVLVLTLRGETINALVLAGS